MGEKYLGRDTLRHFVDTYHELNSSVSVVSDLPRNMYHEVDVLPSVGACGKMAKRIVEVDIWWIGGGSNSIIHKVNTCLSLYDVSDLAIDHTYVLYSSNCIGCIPHDHCISNRLQ